MYIGAYCERELMRTYETFFRKQLIFNRIKKSIDFNKCLDPDYFDFTPNN